MTKRSDSLASGALGGRLGKAEGQI
jgi:hypothetical protein